MSTPAMSRAVVPTGCPLSARELESLLLVHRGHSYKQAARQLGVAYSTVRTHVSAACSKLSVSSSTLAIARMSREGWLAGMPPPPDEDQRVTPMQRAYLDAFDRHLRGDPRAGDEMTCAFAGIRAGAGLAPRRPRPAAADPLDRLLHAIVGGRQAAHATAA